MALCTPKTNVPPTLRQLMLLLVLCLICALSWSRQVEAKVHARHAGSSLATANNEIDDGNAEKTSTVTGDDDGGGGGAGGVSIAHGAANTVSFMDQLSWKCANNASCIYSLANNVMQSYKRGDTLKLGPVEVVQLPPLKGKAHTTGRGLSSIVDFLHGNAIRIPIGPMVFSVQRAEHDDNYIEIALLKKAVQQGRRGGDGGGLMGGGGDSSGSGGGLLLGGSGGGGGGVLLGAKGGGGSGGSGGGGMGGGILRHHRNKQQGQDKKQFEMYIPMYLAATTFGWTMVAAKAVGLLTLKALVVSKLAFVVAAMVIIKKLMDNASGEKMMYQYPEHTPYMMPYGMDYPMHPAMGGGTGGGAMEMGGNEMYPAALHLAAAPQPMAPQHGHSGMESLGAESNLQHNFAEMQNNTQVLAALNAVSLGQKVKREDSWIAKIQHHLARLSGASSSISSGSSHHQRPIRQRPPFNNAGTMAAVIAAAEATVEEDDEQEGDDIFNSEESFKDTLEYLGVDLRRRATVNDD